MIFSFSVLGYTISIQVFFQQGVVCLYRTWWPPGSPGIWDRRRVLGGQMRLSSSSLASDPSPGGPRWGHQCLPGGQGGSHLTWKPYNRLCLCFQIFLGLIPILFISDFLSGSGSIVFHSSGQMGGQQILVLFSVERPYCRCEA